MRSLLFGSEGKQLALECPATVVFRDCDEQFVVAWVEMDMGLVAETECTERVIIAVRQGILPRENRLSVQVDHDVVAVADFEDFPHRPSQMRFGSERIRL